MRNFVKIVTKKHKRRTGELLDEGRKPKKTQKRGKSRREQWEEI